MPSLGWAAVGAGAGVDWAGGGVTASDVKTSWLGSGARVGPSGDVGGGSAEGWPDGSTLDRGGGDSVWPTGEQPVMLPKVSARRRKAHTAHSDAPNAAKVFNRSLMEIPPIYFLIPGYIENALEC